MPSCAQTHLFDPRAISGVSPDTKGAIMVDEAKSAVGAPVKLVVADVPHAPFIFFDEAPISGILPGMVTISLSAKAVTSNGSNVESKDVVVAYLRCTRAAAVSLRRAIDKALLMGEPTQGAAN